MNSITAKNILSVLKLLLIYYLSAKMICFAIPKFFFMQFRILHWESYLPLVEISRQEHMWSFFGRSYLYNIFIGIAEFTIGALVVFRRTRLIALLISLGVCVNIVILNFEFDIDFAIYHVLFDLVVTLILLSTYFNDLYRFFIEQGGKITTSGFNAKRKRLKTLLPLLFVVILSVSYSIYAYSLKSTVNESIVGTYRIKNLQIGEQEVPLHPGKLGSHPMMFLEYNNQLVLSVNDSIYFGGYHLEENRISLGFRSPTVSGLKFVRGKIGKDSLTGITGDSLQFQLIYQRIDGEENYLNDLYQ